MSTAEPGRASIRVTLVYSPAPRQVFEWALELPIGASVLQGLHASPLLSRFPALSPDAIEVGVWGRKARPAQLLRENDRIEIYRPLTVDPKVARRERFVRQGSRAAGLFKRR